VWASGLMLALLGAASEVRAQQPLAPSEVELEDVVAIEIFDRDVVAYDLLGTSTFRLRLEIGERLMWSAASGRVGIVLTDRRILAASPTSESWQEVRYQVQETPATRALMGKRVAMVVTNRRAVGYDGKIGLYSEVSFGPHESVDDARVGDSTAVVLTNRSAYGMSPDTGGFYKTDLSVQERIDGLRVRSNSATVSTSRRILVFRAPSGVWTEEKRPIN